MLTRLSRLRPAVQYTACTFNDSSGLLVISNLYIEEHMRPDDRHDMRPSLQY